MRQMAVKRHRVLTILARGTGADSRGGLGDHLLARRIMHMLMCEGTVTGNNRTAPLSLIQRLS